jgi:hypothetical protein
MEVDESDPLGRVRTIQRPVYYISEVLHDTKTRYLKVHKLLYAVLIASVRSPNATGNIAKWAIELAEFELVGQRGSPAPYSRRGTIQIHGAP